jgi:hypothetical protein
MRAAFYIFVRFWLVFRIEMIVKRYCFYPNPVTRVAISLTEHAQEVRDEKLYTSWWCGGEYQPPTTGEKKLVGRKAPVIVFDFLL